MNTKKEIARFCIAGAVVGAADFGVYYALIQYLPVNLSKGLSFTFAGIIGYLFSKFWVFDLQKSSYSMIGRYALINGLALIINVTINGYILRLFPGAIFSALLLVSDGFQKPIYN